MNISPIYSSPNFSNDVIPVEFVVLHYTATDLPGTVAIFNDVVRGACAHFILDLDGTVYDLGGFLNGPVRRGAHAGESRVDIDGKMITTLNDRSIGIEIINFNGNVFPFTEAQYSALNQLLGHLIARFPKLREPGRIVGHEHIASFRGKCDPGVRFDWARVLKAVGARVTRPAPAARVQRRGLGVHRRRARRRPRAHARFLVAAQLATRRAHPQPPAEGGSRVNRHFRSLTFAVICLALVACTSAPTVAPRDPAIYPLTRARFTRSTWTTCSPK